MNKQEHGLFLRYQISVLNDFQFCVSFQFLLTSEIGNICQALMQFVTFIPVSSTSATTTSAGVAAIVDGPLTWACTGCALSHPYSREKRKKVADIRILILDDFGAVMCFPCKTDRKHVHNNCKYNYIQIYIHDAEVFVCFGAIIVHY